MTSAKPDRIDVGAGSSQELAADDDDRSPAGIVSRIELVISIMTAIVGAGIVLYAARNWWFHDDAWGFLTSRSFTDPLSILRPHAGHWLSPTVLAYLVIGAVAGMHFWPTYYLPRAFGYAAWSWWLWRVLRFRGTHPAAALAFLSLSLVLSVSEWQDLSTIGNLIVLSVAMKVALMAIETPRSRTAFRVKLLALLVLAVASSSLGVALLIGASAAAILSRERWSIWWPSLLGTYITYGTWYLLFSTTVPSTFNTVDVLRSAPRLGFQVLQNATAELTRNSFLAPILLVGLAILLIWLAFRQLLDGFDYVLLFTLGAFLGMIVVYRILPGLAAPTATRYAQNAIFLLAPVVLPWIAPQKYKMQSLAAALLIVLIVPAHWSTLSDRINFWERRAQANMQVVTSAASLMATGEPWLEHSPIDSPRGGMLTTTRLNELVQQGWRPPPSKDVVAVERARSDLRVSVRPNGQLSDQLPRILAGTVEGGCAISSAGEPIVFEIATTKALRVNSNGLDVEMVWTDEYGQGTRVVVPKSRLATGFVLRTIDPASTATLSLQAPEAGAFTVCGGE